MKFSIIMLIIWFVLYGISYFVKGSSEDVLALLLMISAFLVAVGLIANN